MVAIFMKKSPNSLLISEHNSQLICRLLADLMLKNRFFLSTAESCTGGLVAAACTELAGSSQWFDRGFVTYSNAAKTDMLGVEAALIAQYGAVSAQVAGAMAHGAIKHSTAQVSVAVTGVAGPSGGSGDKPVGTVWLGWCVQGQTTTQGCQFAGDRAAVRSQAVQYALQGLVDRLQ